MKYDCLVCGYPDMDSPPRNHEICPCCGTQFGLDDYDHSIPQLRAHWISIGAPWFSQNTRKPRGWSATLQLAEAELLPIQQATEIGVTEASVKISLRKKANSRKAFEITPAVHA